MIQRRVFVSGKVQGVSYRATTLDEATKYPAVRGFVRNLSDGRVEAVFAGPEKDVLALVAWCRKGPALARVSRLEVREEPVDESLSCFQVTGDRL